MLTYTYRYNRVIRWFRDHPVSKKNQLCEYHHIQPRSCHGSDKKENIVTLPARWHYIVHCWLPFVMLERNDRNGYYRMLSAWERMTTGNNNFKYNIKEDSKTYAFIRQLANEAISERLKEKFTSEKHHAKDTIWISNLETNKTKMIQRNEEIPSGWVKGRVTVKDCFWISNLETGERKQIKRTEDIPEGWIKGDTKYQSEIWITNGITQTRIGKDQTIPIGWRRGRIVNFPEESKKRSIEKQKTTCRTTIKITNGKDTFRILKEKPIPNGYRIVQRKRTVNRSTLGLKAITDGKITRFHNPALPLPNGFRYGRSKKNQEKKICMADETKTDTI